MKKKKKVLLLIETSTSYGRDILQGIAQYVRERNNWIYNIDLRGIDDPVPVLEKWEGDGVLSRLSSKRIHRQIRARGLAHVELLHDSLSEVECDDHLIAKQVVDYFWGLGFRRFAYFSFGGTAWILRRGKTFAEECQRRGQDSFMFMPERSRDDVRPEPKWQESYEHELSLWLRKLPKPTAILTANDNQALYLMSYCREWNITIPDQVAVMGVNNDTHLCSLVSPTLSSVDQNAERIGYEAARILDWKMAHPGQKHDRVYTSPGKIVVRESTDTMAIHHPGVVKAVRFIRENATSGITLADVLTAAETQERTLQRWFRKALGHTIKQEILGAQLKSALSLLRDSNNTTKSIARQTGFITEQAFLTAFRRSFGISPYQYRRGNKGEDPEEY